jgi:hypothetical protein
MADMVMTGEGIAITMTVITVVDMKDEDMTVTVMDGIMKTVTNTEEDNTTVGKKNI